MGNEPDDTHLLAATAEKRIGLVDATDQACSRFPAGRMSGTLGYRTGRFVFRRSVKERTNLFGQGHLRTENGLEFVQVAGMLGASERYTQMIAQMDQDFVNNVLCAIKDSKTIVTFRSQTK